MKVLVTIFIFLVPLSLFAQTCEWASGGGLSETDAGDMGYGVVTDNKSNVYLVGDYSYSLNFQGNVFNGLPWGNSLLAKFSDNGSFVWAQTMSGGHCRAVATDQDGYIYITGQCGNTTFQGFSSNINVAAQTSAFIAKYDSLGNIYWVKTFGDSLHEEIGQTIKVDKNGNIFIAGTSTYYTYTNYFCVKFDASGNVLWSKTTGAEITARGLDIDDEGNCYVIGYFQDSVNFNEITLSTSIQAVFLVKYDIDGNVIWARKAADANGIQGTAISINKYNDFYITGRCSNGSNFDGNVINNIGGTNMFVGKYDKDGNLLWVKGASTGSAAFDVKADTAGNCLVIGHFTNSCTFGSGSASQTVYSSKANADIFLAKYTKDGEYEWVFNPTGSYLESNSGIALNINKNNDCLITGSFSDTTIFSNISLYAPRPSHGYGDIFIAKINNTETQLNVLDLSEQNILTIFPNPSLSQITVLYNSQEPINRFQLSIKNTLGQTVYSLDNKENISKEFSITIDLSDKNKGIYFVEIMVDKKRTVKRIVLN